MRRMVRRQYTVLRCAGCGAGLLGAGGGRQVREADERVRREGRLPVAPASALLSECRSFFDV